VFRTILVRMFGWMALVISHDYLLRSDTLRNYGGPFVIAAAINVMKGYQQLLTSALLDCNSLRSRKLFFKKAGPKLA